MSEPISLVDRLSDRAFRSLSQVVYQQTGIALSDAKRSLLASRLQKRLRLLSLEDFDDYRAYLEVHQEELQPFINAVTTNKTEFFRESVQFDDLRTRLLPRLIKSGRARLRLWCAASSTGEEAWTLAMSVWDALPAPERFDVRILATDIDTAVLAKAKEGLYDEERIAGVDRRRLEQHFERTDAGYSVRPHLRAWVDFRQLNLIAPQWPHRAAFDAVFCRNVMIYFDHQTKDRLVRRLASHVAKDGRLYLGLSEAVHWMPEVWTPVGPSTYEHAGAEPEVVAQSTLPAPRPAAPPAPAPRASAPTSARPPPLEGLPRNRIIVGEVFSSATPAVASTLLGSCVAIGLTDPKKGVGGLNHFLLPEAKEQGVSSAASYGAWAIELLINAVLKAGGERRNLEAKIFGGGRVLQGMTGSLIGDQNLAFARAFLERDGIRVVSERRGGDVGLDVSYVTSTGQAFVREIPMTQLQDTAEQERRHQRQVERDRVAKQQALDEGVELF